jgi:tetratricopeptide (TPR) repeat protein
MDGYPSASKLLVFKKKARTAVRAFFLRAFQVQPLHWYHSATYNAAMETEIDMLDSLLSQRNYQQAVVLGQQLTGKFPRSVRAWLSYSEALRSTGCCDQAICASSEALALQPIDAFALAQHARCLLPAADFSALSEVLKQGLHTRDATIWALETLASCAVGIDHWEYAQKYYELLCQQFPRNAHYQAMLGVTLSVRGDTSASAEHLLAALQLNPAQGNACWSLMDVAPDRVNEQQVRQQIQNPALSELQKVYFYQVLGQICQRQKKYQESFFYYQRANTIRRNTLRYSLQQDKQFFEDLIGNFTDDPVNHNSDAHESISQAPIFIVGLPRSGSTLVERILVNSDAVEAVGELRDMEVLLLQSAGRQAVESLRAGDTARILEQDLSLTGERYLQRARSRLLVKGKRVSDKNPFNFRFIGFIMRALPQARIVHVRKAPLDACFGNYKHLFASAAPYSWTLEELGEYYALYAMLMQHWEKLYPQQILTVQYEELLQDPQSVSRELFAFCGLDWRAQVVDMAQHTGEIKTASANQVRRGIHGKAVGVASHYADELQPLRQILQAHGLIE